MPQRIAYRVRAERRGELIGVVPSAAVQEIIAKATIQRVGTEATAQRIDPGATVHRVIEIRPGDAIRTISSINGDGTRQRGELGRGDARQINRVVERTNRVDVDARHLIGKQRLNTVQVVVVGINVRTIDEYLVRGIRHIDRDDHAVARIDINVEQPRCEDARHRQHLPVFELAQRELGGVVE